MYNAGGERVERGRREESIVGLSFFVVLDWKRDLYYCHASILLSSIDCGLGRSEGVRSLYIHVHTSHAGLSLAKNIRGGGLAWLLGQSYEGPEFTAAKKIKSAHRSAIITVDELLLKASTIELRYFYVLGAVDGLEMAMTAIATISSAVLLMIVTAAQESCVFTALCCYLYTHSWGFVRPWPG